MKEPVFTGSCTALITPFAEGGEGPDLGRMGKLLDFQAENGTAAVVLAGTTGENATLTQREYEQLVEFAAGYVDGRMKLIVGIGGNDTARCVEKARFASAAGADAVLMTAPYYNKTTQQGVLRHFSVAADAAEVPLILYNVPSRTAIGIAASTYQALSRHPNINGVKEASGDFTLIAYLAAECGGALHLWCGNDDQTIPMMALGALGVISVVSNVLPAEVAKLCALCAAENFAGARAEYARWAEFGRLLFRETNPIPVKAAMRLAGLDCGELRLPLVDLSPESLEMLKASMRQLGLYPVKPTVAKI